MLRLRYISLLLILLVGCDYISLERDNPYDRSNPNYDKSIHDPVLVFDHFELLDWENWYAEKIFPNAELGVSIVVKNISDNDAINVEASFQIDTTYARISSPNGGYYIIYANSLSIVKENIYVHIYKDTPIGTKIPVKVNLYDDSGNDWEFEFSLDVESEH